MSDSASDTGEDHSSQGRDLDQGEILARSLVSSKEAVEVLGAALAGPLVNALKAQGMGPPNNQSQPPVRGFGHPPYGGHHPAFFPPGS